ncbi:MAG: hypothetical protein LBF28_00365 [Rickettsiales bacterium]|jgi:hypothetical protein|nr:hypothetical protein [Rickettsiales bacterium]
MKKLLIIFFFISAFCVIDAFGISVPANIATSKYLSTCNTRWNSSGRNSAELSAETAKADLTNFSSVLKGKERDYLISCVEGLENTQNGSVGSKPAAVSAAPLSTNEFSDISTCLSSKTNDCECQLIDGGPKAKKICKNDKKADASAEELKQAQKECADKGQGYEWKKIEGKAAGIKKFFMKDTQGYHCDNSGYKTAVKQYHDAIDTARDTYNSEVKDILAAREKAVKEATRPEDKK